MTDGGDSRARRGLYIAISRNRSAEPITEIGVIPSNVAAGQILGMEAGHIPIRKNIRETHTGDMRQHIKGSRPLYLSVRRSHDPALPPFNDLCLDFGYESENSSLSGYEFIAHFAEGTGKRVILFGRRMSCDAWQSHLQSLAADGEMRKEKSLRRFGPIEEIGICTPKHVKEKAFALWDVGPLILSLSLALALALLLPLSCSLSHIIHTQTLTNTHIHTHTHIIYTHSLTHLCPSVEESYNDRRRCYLNGTKLRSTSSPIRLCVRRPVSDAYEKGVISQVGVYFGGEVPIGWTVVRNFVFGQGDASLSERSKVYLMYYRTQRPREAVTAISYAKRKDLPIEPGWLQVPGSDRLGTSIVLVYQTCLLSAPPPPPLPTLFSYPFMVPSPASLSLLPIVDVAVLFLNYETVPPGLLSLSLSHTHTHIRTHTYPSLFLPPQA